MSKDAFLLPFSFTSESKSSKLSNVKTIIPLLFIIFLLAFISCGKAVDIEGVVLSKHNVPVSNVSIRLQLFKGSDYPEYETDLVKTDAQGNYKIHMPFAITGFIKCFVSAIAEVPRVLI